MLSCVHNNIVFFIPEAESFNKQEADDSHAEREPGLIEKIEKINKAHKEDIHVELVEGDIVRRDGNQKRNAYRNGWKTHDIAYFFSDGKNLKVPRRIQR